MRIKMVGASGPFTADKLAPGVARLRAAGHDVDDEDVISPGHAYLNGDDQTRQKKLQAALSSSADVVWIARGGYGLSRIVEDISFKEQGHHPLVVGFSDVTALFCAMKNFGILSRAVHGPLGVTLGLEPADAFAHALAVVEGRPTRFPQLCPLPSAPAAHDVEGPLFAANAMVLAALCGTPSQVRLDGHIVVVEEIGERPYRLDRVLTQLILAGVFRGVRAVVVGHVTRCVEPPGMEVPGRDPMPTGLDVLLERLSTLGVPLFTGAPVGHEQPNWALPLGKHATLTRDGTLSW